MGFDVGLQDQTDPEYEIADNMAVNLVDAIRSDMVGNEEAFLLANAAYATGLSPRTETYNAIQIQGSSGAGKSDLKQRVDELWPNGWLLRLSDTSEKGLIDDQRWNDVYVFAGDEQNKLPSSAIEILKSSFGDDGDEDGWGYTYTRNTSQQDDDEDTTEFKKQTLPFVTLIADENEQKGTDHELGTRNVTLRVEDNEDINEAVSEAMWGAQNVTLPDREYEYNYVFEDGKQAIRQHISNIPRFPQSGTNAPSGWMHNQQYSYPVLIPYDDTMEWPSPQGPIKWKAHKVIKSMFSFKRTESKRASKSVRNFVRGWTILNHHNRDVIEMDGHEWLVAAPQDVGNVIATRQTLLGLTHNFNEKNMAVVRALTDPDNGVGGAGPQGGVAATIQDIHEYLEEYADITSVSEPHLRTNILQEMADRFLITIHEGEGENGAHLYEYHGGSVFGHPNVDEYPEIFANVTDPIRDQPIKETIAQTKEQLNARTTDSLFESQGGLSGAMGADSDSSTTASETDTQSSDGLGQYGTGTQTDTEVELTAIESLVAEKLRATIDDCRVTTADMESLDVSHMVGASPVEYYSGDDGYQYVRAERPYNDGDKTDTILDTNHSHWGANVDMNKVQATVETAIASLRDKEVFEAYSEDDGVLYLLVNEQ